MDVGQDGSHLNLKHPTKPGKVTVPIHGSRDLKVGTLKSIEGREPDKRVGMAQRFDPAVIVQDTGDGPDGGYGVIFADSPGCVSGLDTIQQATAMAAEALSGHIEAMVRDNDPVPGPSDPGLIPDWFDPADSVAVAHVMIPVETPGRIVRVNLTMNEALLARVDAAASARGMSRSGYVAEAVRDRLRA